MITYPSDRIRALVDKKILTLSTAKFVIDPVLGSHSLLASIYSSVPKRHGEIIENAIADALLESGEYLVLTKVRYIVPQAADHVYGAQTMSSSLQTRLPYGDVGGRSLLLDLVAYHRPSCRIGAYEIKRGNGAHDAGKVRSLTRDVVAIQTTLASFGEGRGLRVTQPISRAIFYYGARGSMPKELSLNGSQLDEHFGWHVRENVEIATAYYRARWVEMLEGLGEHRPEIRQTELELRI